MTFFKPTESNQSSVNIKILLFRFQKISEGVEKKVRMHSALFLSYTVTHTHSVLSHVIHCHSHSLTHTVTLSVIYSPLCTL